MGESWIFVPDKESRGRFEFERRTQQSGAENAKWDPYKLHILVRDREEWRTTVFGAR
jgi:hypothetical protein